MNLDHRKTLDYYVGGSLILAIKPIVTLLGRILRRNHDIQPRGRVVFTKMLGGGTLVIALPALLGLRRHLADQQFGIHNLFVPKDEEREWIGLID